jgi:hypothetical protein
MNTTCDLFPIAPALVVESPKPNLAILLRGNGPVDLTDLRASISSNEWRISTHENPYMTDPRYMGREDGAWEVAMKHGMSYMAGIEYPAEPVPTNLISYLNAWQKEAFLYCAANPTRMINIRNSRAEWDIYSRGEYVEFCLPHHDRGGEHSYISCDGKTKVHVNAD